MTDDERDQAARDMLAMLEEAENRILADCAKHVSSPAQANVNQYLFLFAAARRLLTQARAFKQCVADNNGQIASALLRMQLDTVMRLYAIFWVKDPEVFTTAVLGGRDINKMTDRHKQQMTDKHLRSKLTDTYPWIEAVYKSTSGYIHFSGTHMIKALELDPASGQPMVSIGSNDGDRPVGYYREVITAFVHTTMLAHTAIQDSFERLLKDGTVGDLPTTA